MPYTFFNVNFDLEKTQHCSADMCMTSLSGDKWLHFLLAGQEC